MNFGYYKKEKKQLAQMKQYERKQEKNIRYICAIALIATMLLSLVSCSAPASEGGEANENPRRVIIDSDSGADDSAAIILAAKKSELEIEGVTVLAGNVDVENAAKNSLMALEVAGASVPVYKGATESVSKEPFDPYSVFGKDGMGDADLIHPTGKAEDKNAIDFILETVKKYPGEIEIIALGPATNIANAIQKDPETMKQVKMIWSLGTTGLGAGNASPVAEFNVYADAEAYKIMLDSGIDTTIVGLDMCGGDAMWTDKQFEKLEASGDIGVFVSKSFEELRNFYEKNGEDAVSVCDPETILCATEDDFVKDSIKCHGSCITEKGETYGEVVFYKEGFTYDLEVPEGMDYSVTLVTEIDQSGYFDRYLKAIR